MYANSSIPESAQQGIHESLIARVTRHAASDFRKPYADYNVAAFETSMKGWDGRAPLVLDAGCGVGHSTIALARALPDHYVIGVDQSEDRLTRKKPYPDALMPANMAFVRADLIDYWRLLAAEKIRLARHYILYPNPWPKIGHLSRRWHAHPVFPVLPGLGGRLECRTNWQIYIEEFAAAMSHLTQVEQCWQTFEAAIPLSPFERKYRDSGQTLFQCVVELDHLKEDPS